MPITTLSYADVVARMYDLKGLANPPLPGEVSGNFSSRDRASRFNPVTERYENWHANNDADGALDDDGTFFDLEGSGVVWRIWSAMPGDGDWQFYVDGDTEPTFAKPFKQLFADDFDELPELPELSQIKARGYNRFVPITFNKSLKIRGSEGWGRYYQITYTRFPKGTTVPSFDGTLTESQRSALRTANSIWSQRGPFLFVDNPAAVTDTTVSLGAGEEKVLATFDSPAALTSIFMKRPPVDRSESVRILRELTISLTWDDDDSPAVWAPLGDFFGTGAGENLHRTLTTGMTERGYYSNWYMPFRKAVIRVKNDGKATRDLRFAFHTETLERDPDQLLRFHCKWHRDDFSGFDQERLMSDRWPDWPVLHLDGVSGRFCGFHAHMWNPNHLWDDRAKQRFVTPLPDAESFRSASPQRAFYLGEVDTHYWWGEGDEKFFVDGEAMPSTFGTGSEDYFGYAWGQPTAFDSALQAQPRNGEADQIGKSADRAGPGNIGHITQARWQVPDNVPFQRSFEAVIEKYHGNNWPLLNAYTVCWYQTAGVADPYQPVDVEQRVDYYVPAISQPALPVVDGVLEGSHWGHIDVVGSPDGPTSVQEMRVFGDGWSSNAHLLWRASGEGAKLEVQFGVDQETTGLAIGLTKAPDYCSVQVWLDGNRIGQPIDCYDDAVVRAGDVRFESPVLEQGTHRLTFEVVGKNEQSTGYLFGLDDVRLGG
ncbi:glycoside hydrolase family 172 protein [Rhodopirellula sp. MGV]|uniref:glycoside hydrolase family 172 protein n=1 Tax=Rhodopirellula sp. MGV TaxID=2023130 RepID=UPI0011798EA2|nr:glycoside hydrolase family 172 protein [Rhodopirellula sp. MGV]